MTQDPRYSQGMSGRTDGGGTEFGRDGSDGSDTLSDRAGDAASMVQDRATEAGSKLHEQADMGIDKAAGGLESAAEQMRDRFADQDGMQGQVGGKMADGLERTAGYLREHDADKIWEDVEAFVKDHPLQSAAGAALAGFVIARVLR